MYRLKIGSLPLPKLYICESRAEANDCRDRGIPYLIRPRGWDDEKLVKAILFKTLKDLFPAIKWNQVFGLTNKAAALKVHVPAEWRECVGDTCGFSDPDMQVSEDGEYRGSGGGLAEDDTLANAAVNWDDMSIDKYLGDLGWAVNIEELQALKLLPKFMDDIANAIKVNLSNTMWLDGYNKKLGCCLGKWQGTEEAPNLIILDTSSSVPSGVATTMIGLIDTLRHQANADLIITTGRSEYWPANADLPGPDQLGYLIGGCNECRQFYGILRKHIFGRHWGNVIVFGDQDAPEDDRFKRYSDSWLKGSEMSNTRIDRIMGFHTYAKKMPGYGLWALDCAPNAQVILNNQWVDDMDRDRRVRY